VKLVAEIVYRTISLMSLIYSSVPQAEIEVKSFVAFASSIFPAEIRFARLVTVRFEEPD